MQANAVDSKIAMGMEYIVEHVRKGVLIDKFAAHNIVPTEGLNHALSVILQGGTQQGTWYLGIFEGNYTPVPGITAATVVAAATECTAYDEATRPIWVGGTVSAGAVTNEDNRAVFTMNDEKDVYGAFLISSSAKSASVGVLFSIVRFPTVKQVESGDILRVRAAFVNESAN